MTTHIFNPGDRVIDRLDAPGVIIALYEPTGSAWVLFDGWGGPIAWPLEELRPEPLVKSLRDVISDAMCAVSYVLPYSTDVASVTAAVQAWIDGQEGGK